MSQWRNYYLCSLCSLDTVTFPLQRSAVTARQKLRETHGHLSIKATVAKNNLADNYHSGIRAMVGFFRRRNSDNVEINFTVCLLGWPFTHFSSLKLIPSKDGPYLVSMRTLSWFAKRSKQWSKLYPTYIMSKFSTDANCRCRLQRSRPKLIRPQICHVNCIATKAWKCLSSIERNFASLFGRWAFYRCYPI